MRIEWMEKYMADAERLIYENKVDEGLVLLNNLLYDEPGYGSLHNHLGWAYMYYTTETAKAETHFNMAITFQSDFAAPYLHLGILYLRNGRYIEALSTLELGLTKPNANRVVLLENMAHVYELKGEFRDAIRTYKEAAKSTLVSHEVNNLMEGVKRCRKKRLALLFTF
jgi:tetratricopeptide (TPR) repeat protein